MRSMTGYGRGVASVNGWSVSVELSGVNRKQVDISVSLPPSLLELEGEARALLARSVSRGRIGAKVTLSHEGTLDNRLLFDQSLARQYLSALRQMAGEAGLDPGLSASDLFRAPGVFRVDELSADPAELRSALVSALETALAQLVRMQRDEGDHLRSDLSARIETLASETEGIRELAPGVPAHHRQNLMRRLRESGVELDLDDDRLLREIALFAERCDVTEELTRISSHLGLFRIYLSSEEPMGRPLDFLCQELHREFNTIGSKANDAAISRRVVHAKTELEKIREQVQNVQ